MAALLPSGHSLTTGVAANPGGQMPLLLLLLLPLLCSEGMLMVAASRMVPLLASTTCSGKSTGKRV
jgi:hypothetical protein